MFTRSTHTTYTPAELVQSVWNSQPWKKDLRETIERLFHNEDTNAIVNEITASFYETVEVLDIDTNAVENVQQLDNALATLLIYLEQKIKQIVPTY